MVAFSYLIMNEIAFDDGVWLCCVGCFQNSSPQTSLVISSRKVQADLPVFFVVSVPEPCKHRGGQLVALQAAGLMAHPFQAAFVEAGPWASAS